MVGELAAGVLFSKATEGSQFLSCSFNRFKDIINLFLKVSSDGLRTSLSSVFCSSLKVLAQAQLLSNRFVSSMVFTHRCSNLGQVVNAFWRNDTLGRPHLINRFLGFKADDFREFAPQSVNPTVSELAGDGRYDRQFFIRNIEHVSVPSNLLSNRSEGIFTASLFVLVEHDNISDIEHLNLFELCVSAELSRHDVERMVCNRRDGIAALANSTCFAENHVETHCFGDFDGSVKVGTDFRTRTSTG